MQLRQTLELASTTNKWQKTTSARPIAASVGCLFIFDENVVGCRLIKGLLSITACNADFEGQNKSMNKKLTVFYVWLFCPLQSHSINIHVINNHFSSILNIYSLNNCRYVYAGFIT